MPKHIVPKDQVTQEAISTGRTPAEENRTVPIWLVILIGFAAGFVAGFDLGAVYPTAEAKTTLADAHDEARFNATPFGAPASLVHRFRFARFVGTAALDHFSWPTALAPVAAHALFAHYAPEKAESPALVVLETRATHASSLVRRLSS